MLTAGDTLQDLHSLHDEHSFDPSLDRKKLDTVNNVKILGLTISNNLLWNDHINNIVKKTKKRLYFIVLLKRAQVPLKDIIMFYCTCIRPVLEYCTPVFNHALPKYLSEDLERVQKRVLSIVSPGETYQRNLEIFQLTTLRQRRHDLCDKLFNQIIRDQSHKLFHLLPQRHQSKYNLRRKKTFDILRINTKRYQNTFIPSMFCRQNKYKLKEH